MDVGKLMDLGCTLDLGQIIDLGCELLHLHHALSAVADLFIISGESLCNVKK